MGKNLGRLLLAIMVAVLALPVTAGAAPNNAQQDGKVEIESNAWSNYHWARTANPFTLRLGDNVTSVWDSYLSTASADWNQSTVLDTTIAPGGTKPKSCRGTAGRVEVCNSTYGNTGWLGIAQISVSGSHITQGIVKLNDTYFNTSTYNSSEWRQMVTCQEIGHTFGLDHQDTNFDNANLNTCMDYTNDPSTNQKPSQHDFDQLQTIYSHLDSTTTINNSATTKPGKGNLDTPSSWGKLVSSSKDGRFAVYVRDFGNGQKVITNVVRAD